MKNKLLRICLFVVTIFLLIILLKNIINKEELISQTGKISKLNTTTYAVSNWDLNKVTVVTDTAGVSVPVPKGYVASGADGEHTVSKGFVIYQGETAVTTANANAESKTRNQYVWVPVPDVSRIYEEDANGIKSTKSYLYSTTGRTRVTDFVAPGLVDAESQYNFLVNGFQNISREQLQKKLQLEFDETIESIKKYGGFYIGRYELGDISKKLPVVKRMNTDLGNQPMYKVMETVGNVAANTNVKTNIIWGNLWIETFQWLVDTGTKTYNDLAGTVTTWGNCVSSSFKYVNSSGSTVTKSSGYAIQIPAGSSEYTKANNIYDLIGNQWEWMLDVLWGGRYIAGSDYGGNHNLTVRYSDFPNTYKESKRI